METYYNFRDIIIELNKLDKMQIGKYHDYTDSIMKWFYEIAIKNRIIYNSKQCFQTSEKHDVELIDRPRGRVYWTDFGINIGSEFNDYHFCVVVKEFKFTALVIPMSSIKDEIPEWKREEELIINIGKIPSLPLNNTVDSYAMVYQMRSVSKQRLSVYVSKETGKPYNKLKLDNDQLDLIDTAILSLTNDKTHIRDNLSK